MVIHRDQRRADVRDVLDEFEKWLLRERSAQKRTGAAYTARVAGFVEWLPAPVDQSLRRLTAATLTEWVNLEAARGWKASTLGKQLVMLRSFLQYCHRSARTSQDFSGVVPHAAAWRLSSIPEPVPAGTVEALFDTLDLRSSKGLRDRAILLLLTGLGLRACEIAGLRLDDVGWRTGSLRVRGKGDRIDELPLPDDVGQALKEYVLYGRGGRVQGEEVFWTGGRPYGAHRPRPLIFTGEQIDTLLAAAGRLIPEVRAASWQTLLGLLTATGMRISEARNLDHDDLTLDESGDGSDWARVTDTKFGKSRLVPLHATTMAAIRRYQRLRDRTFPVPKTTAVLVARRGTRIARSTAGNTFREIREMADLAGGSTGPAAKLHDFRPSFATNTLIGHIRAGGDVDQMMPVLSAFLGHVGPEATYWYLSNTPELAAALAERIQASGGR
ncbi:tyrosine-type recombinase/integrase [Ornithinimicrobium avium]|uniref:Integrase n=1 Tax=Ornithinimicrobium avium TaxID=2283195 RepID=A0A345NPU1_9MICO|nr:tyrosine-type recombinase/integrase [Ornithinimicrobium avium]AXH97049.1 hypothetical protein DV701_13790 [Ornithinimicrobium avium]